MRYFVAALLSLALCGVAHAQVVSPGSAYGQGNYPPGATPADNSNTGTTASISANLGGQAGLKTYVCGFDIRATATAAAVGDATLTNVNGGTLHFSQFTATTSGPMVPTQETFWPCLPTSAVNTTIGLNTAAPGSGGVVSATIWGYYAP